MSRKTLTVETRFDFDTGHPTGEWSTITIEVRSPIYKALFENAEGSQYDEIRSYCRMLPCSPECLSQETKPIGASDDWHDLYCPNHTPKCCERDRPVVIIYS